MSFVYDDAIVNPPKYFNLEFFEEVLENGVRQSNLDIKTIRLTMGSATGENYCSQIYRAKIDYRTANESEQDKTLSMIIKAIPDVKGTAFLEEMEVFLKEKIVYRDILPRLQMLLSGPQRFGAQLFHAIRNPTNTLVFEDLTSTNFEMASRQTGLDEAHGLLVVQRLAKLHATSMILGKKEPHIMDHFHSGILAKRALHSKDGTLLRFYKNNATALIDLVSGWPEYEKITNKLRKYCSNLLSNLERCQDPIAGELKVLNHGDMWVNNMLFQYDKQRNVKDVIFIDFQLSIWGSPGIDLNYFFYTSLQMDVLKNKRDALIRAYHDTLIESLKELKYPDPLPTLKDIQHEVRQRLPHGFYASYGIFPLVALEKELSNDSSIENLIDEDTGQKRSKIMFSSPRVAQQMRYVLKEFDAMGIWD